MAIPNSNTRRNAVDLTGRKFGRWTVISYHDKVVYKYATGGCTVLRWLCRCECGVEKVIRGNTLVNGGTTSCKCYQREFQRERRTTHGLTGTPEYHAWAHLIQRLTNPKDAEYHNYGGRGLTFDPRWASFENFIADMGMKAGRELSIERRNNHRGYWPDNCYWATAKEQNRNKRTNRWIEWQGRRQLITEWSVELGGKPHSLTTRFSRGWSLERAMTTPFTTLTLATAPQSQSG